MLLAIDIGNTHSVFGVHDGSRWQAMWRRQTNAEATEDEVASWLFGLLSREGLPGAFDHIALASVVPAADRAIVDLCDKWFQCPLFQLKTGMQAGLSVLYDPPAAVGADRIANALGALALVQPPIVVVDFGTATTFDAIDGDGSYVGGAIMPGVHLSAQALFSRAAKLPQVDLVAPPSALGKDTRTALQSGLVLGYAGAIERIAGEISSELGGAFVMTTGGLADLFVGLCPSIQRHEPNLTLDGLMIAFARTRKANLQ